ncbi:hypothetical protein SAMN04487948_107119 [Halogranum amylolyticum]|uniref:Uncharacterized protein n=1 Tax=Halogranum amylolyticum TaxID=660520 RepID=A0A1H8TK22_9EURY|nr:hypothetical protein [Halogranum amylolyticum]SEO91207.1 hypothetical protein SAMN04487948_107119 [Halogranum amylolyticum]
MCPETLTDDLDSVSETSTPTTEGFVDGLKAGIVATLVMSAYRIPVARSPPPTAHFWAKFVGDGDPEQYPLVGLVLHLAYGAGGGGGFGSLMALLFGTPADDQEHERLSTLCGVLFALVLAKFGTTVVLARVLDLDLDADERFVFDMSHVVYGLTLGTWFGANA